MHNALFARSGARTAKSSYVLCVAASLDGLAAGAPLAASLAVVIIVVMIATACSHEHRIVTVIVIENGHALRQALIVTWRREHSDAPL